ncbi:MAG: hypothetical protein CSB55_05690 [Candidatus Cloacimonadota bacterium]|nr:MAG: hypothetical protein CSB55_05690 [Candidatus Cloacimonadota bacterium]
MNENKLSKYLDISGSFIISLNREQIITYINKSGANILGYEVNEIIGKDYFNLCVSENEREKIRERFIKLFEKPFLKPNNFESNVVTSSGKKRTINWTNTALRDEEGNIIEIVSSGNDITWRICALEKLAESKKKYKSLIEATDTGFCILDKNGYFLEANKKILNILGKKYFQDLQNRQIYEFIAEKHRDFLKENIKFGLEENKVRHCEADFLNNDKKIIPVHVSANRFEDRHQTKIILLCQDITERRKSEEAARQQEIQLMQADKMASLGILVSGVAHEINNPNNFVMLNIPLLEGMWQHIRPILDEYLEEKGDFFIGKRLMYSTVKDSVPGLLTGIYEGSKRIQTIVKELKDYSRKQNENYFEKVNINEVVKTAVILTESLIKRSTSDFKFDLGKDLPFIKGNFQKLEQVIINLLENSCQAITNKKQKIQVTTYCDRKAEKVVCNITDEGIGMDEETLKKILEPFFTTKRTEGGTGLGLAVSSKIIADHGGKLSFKSEPNEGTRVEISVPVYEIEEI